MRHNLPQRDPIRAHARKAMAERCVGIGAKCACGESQPEALINGSDPVTCAKCDREKRGMSTLDGHHVAGEANSPVKLSVPVNDHHAQLSPAQYDWPPDTLKNSDASPLIAGAACIRGFADIVTYLIRALLLWIADMLEVLDAVLVKKLGPKWWVNTELEQFAPERKSNVKP